MTPALSLLVSLQFRNVDSAGPRKGPKGYVAVRHNRNVDALASCKQVIRNNCGLRGPADSIEGVNSRPH